MSDAKTQTAEWLAEVGDFMFKLAAKSGGPVSVGLGLLGGLSKGAANLLHAGASADEIMAAARKRPKIEKPWDPEETPPERPSVKP